MGQSEEAIAVKSASGNGSAFAVTLGGFNKVADSFVNTFVAREGESVEDAKARLAAEQRSREEAAKADAEKRAAEQQARIDASLEASRNAGKKH